MRERLTMNSELNSFSISSILKTDDDVPRPGLAIGVKGCSPHAKTNPGNNVLESNWAAEGMMSPVNMNWHSLLSSASSMSPLFLAPAEAKATNMFSPGHPVSSQTIAPNTNFLANVSRDTSLFDVYNSLVRNKEAGSIFNESIKYDFFKKYNIYLKESYQIFKNQSIFSNASPTSSACFNEDQSKLTFGVYSLNLIKQQH